MADFFVVDSARYKAVATYRTMNAVLVAVSIVFAMNGEAPWSPLLAHLDMANNQDVQHDVLQLRGRKLKTAPEDELRTGEAKSFDVELLQGSDSHSENKGFMQTLVQMVAGWICLFMSFALLWLNEGHTVRMDKLFTLANRRVKNVKVSPADPENLRELIFTTGQTETSDTLTLSNWASVQAPANSAKLRAKMWMYQWVEHKKEKDKTTVYEYKMQWVHHAVDSNSFHEKAGHANPTPPQAFTSRELATTKVGDFTLSQKILGRLQNWQPVEVSDKLAAIADLGCMVHYKVGTMSTHEGRPAVNFKMSAGTGDPSIGDLMVAFEYVPCGTLSVMGIQVPVGQGWSFRPLQFVEHHSFNPLLTRANTQTTNVGDDKHQTLLGEHEEDTYEEEAQDPMKHVKRGAKACMKGFPNPCSMAEKFMSAACPDEVLAVVEKEVSVKQAIAAERSFETKLSWTMRIFGFALMNVSLGAIFSPIRWILAHVWFVGAIINGGISFLTCCCASVFTSCTISVAYVAYRPLYAILGLSCGALVAYSMVFLSGASLSSPTSPGH